MKRELLFIVSALHVSLIAVVHVQDVGVCGALAAGSSKPHPQDVRTALQRAGNADTFNLAAITEVMVILAMPLLPSWRVLPTVLLVDAVAVRARHLGWGGCTPGDTRCCAELQCYSFDNCKQPPYIGGSTNWNDRNNFCPMPHFYVKDSRAKVACRTLANTPDMASCYRYGCSSVHTPSQYWIQRCLLLSLIVVAILGLL